MNSQVLKPCPFCGGNAVKEKEGLSEVYGYADRVTYRCKGCGCTRGAQGVSGRGYADNSTVEERALAAWNTRATPAPIPDAAEGVEVRFNTDDRSKWTVKDWYSHLGAWENDKGQLCFGSTIAFALMLQQFHAECRRQHEVIVSALRDGGGVPEGWKLVPIVPTDEMRDAGNVIVLSRGKLFQAWAQMLAVAPSPLSKPDPTTSQAGVGE